MYVHSYAELGMAGISDDQAADYYYQDDLYLDQPDEKLSCPICLCPVQREAHLTECCGRHFCRSCIGRLRNERKSCPMCKAAHLAIFPNKERQREIKQLRVRCPLSLASYRAVGGRGQETSKSDSGSKAVDKSEEKDFEVTEECCIENRVGFFNASDSSEVTVVTEIFDDLKLSDTNDHSTNHHTCTSSEKVDNIDESHSTEGTCTKAEKGVDNAKDDNSAATTTCDWTGELGQVERHVSEVHGASALQRIKHDDVDDNGTAAQSATAHTHCIHHEHHQHHHSNVHVVQSNRYHPRNQNATYHVVRTAGGVPFHYHSARTVGGDTVHYHRPNPPPFNVFSTAAIASPVSNVHVVGDLYPSVHHPGSSGVECVSSEQEDGEARSSREHQPSSREETRLPAPDATNVLNQDFNVRVSSAGCSTASDSQGITDGSGLQQRQNNTGNASRSSTQRSQYNLEPDTPTGPQFYASVPPPEASSSSQGVPSDRSRPSPSEEEQQGCNTQASGTPASVVSGMPSSPEQFVIVQSQGRRGRGQPTVQFIGPPQARGCPHRYHMRGMHGHRHHHHHHHRPPPHFHHHPPPPPHHAPPGPPPHPHPPPPHGHPPPPRGFPPGAGRGGHPHHHHHHHPRGQHRGCRGHHHHPRPY